MLRVLRLDLGIQEATADRLAEFLRANRVKSCDRDHLQFDLRAGCDVGEICRTKTTLVLQDAILSSAAHCPQRLGWMRCNFF